MQADPKKLRHIILNQPTVSYEEAVKETREVLEADAKWRANSQKKLSGSPRSRKHPKAASTGR